MAHRPFHQQSTGIMYHKPTTPPYYSSPPQQQQGILPNQYGGPPIMNMDSVHFQAPRQALPRGYQMAHRPFHQQSTGIMYHQPTTQPYYSSPPQQESTMWDFAKFIAFTGACVIGGCVLIYNICNKKRDVPQNIPAKPKRPLTSFFQFASEQRPNIVAMYPNMSITDVSKRLGEMWRDMPVHQKDIYKRGFEARREKYVQEMQSYRSRFTKEELASMDEQEREKKKKKAKRRRKSALKKLNKPKGPPNGYCLCIKDYFDLKKEGGRTEYQFEEAVAVWNSLPEDNKLEYNEKASLLMNIYREEMEEWLREMEEKGIKI